MLDIEGPQDSHGPQSRYDELLAPATSKDDDTNFNRASATYTNHDERFRAAKRTYERQYAQLYFSRLMALKEVMRSRVQRLWPGVPVCSILEVQESQEVAVIGTIYKNMKLKPSILDEYSKDRGLKAALGATNFCSDDDSVVLEDEGARMVLSIAAATVSGDVAMLGDSGDQPLNAQELVTGVVLAVRGVHEPGGDFVVSATSYAGLPPNPHPLPGWGPLLVPQQRSQAGMATAAPGDKYVALASGFCLGSSKADMLKIQLVVDFLTGNLGSPAEQQLSAQIVRLVIAGGCISQLDVLAGGIGGNAFNRQVQGAALQPVRDLDLFLVEMAAGLPVDVMPGADDPANVALPQQPMHRCLFPAAGMHASFVRATNPHEFEIDGVRFLGCSGQNLDDMAKYCARQDRLDLMERSLEFRHLAPTAPDTLTCYPFHDKDPFILETTPHVYFVGNQPEFATRLVYRGESGRAAVESSTVVRLVAVPSFVRTGTIVLLNLRTLACHLVRIDGSLGL